MANMDWSERYIKRGDPTKPTYYIIRHELSSIGIMSYFRLAAGYIRYALSKGWIPVIDLQNYPNTYLAPEEIGKKNAWEYYFEQPFNVGLEEAYSGENVVLCASGTPIPLEMPPVTMDYYENKDSTLAEWRNFIKLGMLRVKPEILKEVAALREKFFAPNDRVLGVYLRGTDYVARRPHNHPIPPPIEFAVSTVVAKLQEWQCNKIFLSTEDKTIVQTFKNVFGDLCVTIDRQYVDYNSQQANFITVSRINRENDRFLQGKEYLTEMLLLTMCNSLVVTRCAGAICVMMMTDRFEHTYTFNLGKYGVIGLD